MGIGQVMQPGARSAPHTTTLPNQPSAEASTALAAIAATSNSTATWRLIRDEECTIGRHCWRLLANPAQKFGRQACLDVGS
jgi:hypothetical protein